MYIVLLQVQNVCTFSQTTTIFTVSDPSKLGLLKIIHSSSGIFRIIYWQNPCWPVLDCRLCFWIAFVDFLISSTEVEAKMDQSCDHVRAEEREPWQCSGYSEIPQVMLRCFCSPSLFLVSTQMLNLQCIIELTAPLKTPKLCWISSYIFGRHQSVDLSGNRSSFKPVQIATSVGCNWQIFDPFCLFLFSKIGWLSP